MHSSNNSHSVSHFPYKRIVMSDTSTCINTSLDCFPEKTVTLYIIRCRINVSALYTGLTIETTPSLHILCMYIIYDCINCLQLCFMASKH